MKGTAARVSLALVLLFASAAAEAKGKRIGVPKFEGAQEALVRKKVMASLKSHGFVVVGSRQMADAISSTGASLDSDDGLVAVAKELALSAIITGEVGPKRAKIVVHDGGEGSILADASFTGANAAKLATDVGLSFWKKVGPDVGRGHVPSGAKKAKAPAEDESAAGGEGEAAGGEGGEEKPKPKMEAEAEGGGSDEAAAAKMKKRKPKMEEAPPEEAAAPSAPSGLPWFDWEVGIGGLNRSLSYNQNVQLNGSLALLPYTLGVGPIATSHVVVYLEPLVGGPIGNIGLESEIQQGFAISSTLSSGTSYTNVVHDFAGGARYRFPFWGSCDAYLSVTGGEDAFTFSGANRPSLPIPDTIYHYIRPGVGMHLLVGNALTIALSGGYRAVLNAAGPQLSDPQTGLFPHLTVAGADAQLVGGYRLGEMLEVRAGVEWRRYWFNMHSQPMDRAIAGGMVNQSFAFTLRVALLIGASSVPRSEGGTAEEPPPPPPPNPKGRGRQGTDDGNGEDSGEPPAVKSGGDDE